MPRAQNLRILALIPGAQPLAFAVAQGDRLLYYGIRTLESDRERQLETTGEKAVAAAEAAIDDFSPDALAFLKTCGAGARRTRRVYVINDRIRAVGLRRDVKMYRVAPAAARKAVTGDPEASRSEMVGALASDYLKCKPLDHHDLRSSDTDAADVVHAIGTVLGVVRARSSGCRQVR